MAVQAEVARQSERRAADAGDRTDAAATNSVIRLRADKLRTTARLLSQLGEKEELTKQIAFLKFVQEVKEQLDQARTESADAEQTGQSRIDRVNEAL